MVFVVGSLVKIRLPGEVFWCCVVSIDNDRVYGAVDNDLVNTAEHGYGHGDGIIFSASDVISVWGDK